MAATAEEEAFIRSRLITQTSKANGVLSAITKLTKRYHALCASAENGELKATEDLYQAILREISLYDVQISRLVACQEANLREQKCHTDQREEIENTITKVQKEIDELHGTLDAAREERSHKEAYEVLRRLCMQHPARSETHAAIASVEKEIEKLELEHRKVNAIVEERKKQFALLLHAADELQNDLANENIDSENGAQPMEM